MPPGESPEEQAVGERGLRRGAIGFASSVVIGVASTAPAYTLATTLGFVAAAVGLGSPAVLLISFVPMFLVAIGYYYLNKADADCGTSFAWVTKAMGPQLGWLAGWTIVVADLIVMANLAQIAGLYTLLLFGWSQASAPTVAVTVLGVLWIVLMTAIVLIGIELSARVQIGLLAAELSILVLFAAVALLKVYLGGAPPGAVHPRASWLDPFALSPGQISAGMLLAVFAYWGWDTTATVNEETEDPNEAPGRASVISTVILLAIFVIVAVAAQSYAGVADLVANREDVLNALGGAVLGPTLDKLLIVAVLSSAAAATQTTILPTARTALSMADAKAVPERLGAIHRHFRTPYVATLGMGAASIVWYVGLTLVSESILYDSLAALGLMISFLSRPHGARLRDLLPARTGEQREEPAPRRDRAADRQRHPLLPADQERDRTLQSRQLPIGELVARHRPAARDRRLFRRARPVPDGGPRGPGTRLLPPPAGDRSDRLPASLRAAVRIRAPDGCGHTRMARRSPPRRILA